jgi:hypothetical protein
MTWIKRLQCSFGVGMVPTIFKTSSIHIDGGRGHELIPSVWELLATMQAISTLFKNLTNFTITKFEELTSFMVTMITSHTKPTCEALIVSCRPSKLNIQQWFSNFVLFLKHDNAQGMTPSCEIGVRKGFLCDNNLFVISSCINSSLVDEIHWPMA